MPCISKEIESVKMYFEAVPQGTREEFFPGVFVPINGHFVSKDRQYSLPVVTMMSDYKWQLDCLIDRLFHPEKYEKTENVLKRIAHLVDWLNKHEPEQYKGFRCDFKGLFDYVMTLPENELEAAEKQIKEAFKGIR